MHGGNQVEPLAETPEATAVTIFSDGVWNDYKPKVPQRRENKGFLGGIEAAWPKGGQSGCCWAAFDTEKEFLYEQHYERVNQLRRQKKITDYQAMVLLQIMMQAASRRQSGVFFRTVGQVTDGVKLFLAGLIPILNGLAVATDDPSHASALTYGAMGVGLLLLLLDIYLKIFKPIEVGVQTIMASSRIRWHWNKFVQLDKKKKDETESEFNKLLLAVAKEQKDFTETMNSTFVDAAADATAATTEADATAATTEATRKPEPDPESPTKPTTAPLAPIRSPGTKEG